MFFFCDSLEFYFNLYFFYSFYRFCSLLYLIRQISDHWAERSCRGKLDFCIAFFHFYKFYHTHFNDIYPCLWVYHTFQGFHYLVFHSLTRWTRRDLNPEFLPILIYL